MWAARPDRRTSRLPCARLWSVCSARPNGGATAVLIEMIFASNEMTLVAARIVTVALVRNGSAWTSMSSGSFMQSRIACNAPGRSGPLDWYRLARGGTWMQRWRVPLGFLCAALFLFFAQPTVWTLLVGGIVALPGLGLRAW